MIPKIYLVGGAVRDMLLGNIPKDLDYVVVGADQQWMIDQGFKQVGAAFPVFLHPETGEEYAMARREKKVAPGYQGFEFEFGPDVTLEEDLSRRDLTINSIALRCNDVLKEHCIDPFGGIKDLRKGIIRHTSNAFSEDPLRVMRVARFAARYGFSVSPETTELCKQLVISGELDALSAERIWGELQKLFSEVRSSAGLFFLAEVGALKGVQRLNGLVCDPPENYAEFGHDLEPTLTPLEKMYFNLRLGGLGKNEIEKLKVPGEIVRSWKWIDSITNLIKGGVDKGGVFDGDDYETIVKTLDVFRDEIRSQKLTEVRSFMEKKASETPELPPIQTLFTKLELAYTSLLRLDFTDLVRDLPPMKIKDFVRQEKIRVVREALQRDFSPNVTAVSRGIG